MQSSHYEEVDKMNDNEKKEEYVYPGMSYCELFIAAGIFIFLVWFFFGYYWK